MGLLVPKPASASIIVTYNNGRMVDLPTENKIICFIIIGLVRLHISDDIRSVRCKALLIYLLHVISQVCNSASGTHFVVASPQYEQALKALPELH